MVKFLIGLLLKLLLGSLDALVKKIVADVNLTDLPDADKRKESFDKVKNLSITEGKNLRDSLINLAIELAVSYLKR